jgi:hypothetical protein
MSCRAKLTFVRGKEKLRANCHLKSGHDGTHHGDLKNKDGEEQMAATWSRMNERWVRK